MLSPTCRKGASNRCSTSFGTMANARLSAADISSIEGPVAVHTVLIAERVVQ